MNKEVQMHGKKNKLFFLKHRDSALTHVLIIPSRSCYLVNVATRVSNYSVEDFVRCGNTWEMCSIANLTLKYHLELKCHGNVLVYRHLNQLLG